MKWIIGLAYYMNWGNYLFSVLDIMMLFKHGHKAHR